MPDDAERPERWGELSRLFGELPLRGVSRCLAGLDLSTGELEEASEETGRRSPLDEPSTPRLKDDDRGPDEWSSGPNRPSRDPRRIL